MKKKSSRWHGESSGGGAFDETSMRRSRSSRHGHGSSSPDGKSMRRSQSPDGKSLKSRRSGHTSRESAPLLAKVLGGGEDDERSTLVEAPELPALPTGSRAARALGEWAFIHNKAKDALEKLRKWEWAFEKEQAYPPTAEDKAFSNTYSTYSSKYVKYVTQLRAMEQEEDDGAGVGVERAAPISISDDAAFDGSYGSTGYGGSSSVDSGGGGGGGGGVARRFRPRRRRRRLWRTGSRRTSSWRPSLRSRRRPRPFCSRPAARRSSSLRSARSSSRL